MSRSNPPTPTRAPIPPTTADVLEEGADNPVQQELEEALDALNVDEQFSI